MKLKTNIVICLTALGIASCTKLDQKLQSSILIDPNSNTSTASALLTGAYNDVLGYMGQDGLFSLEENTSDESLVPTRGGDWDDNGVWRVLHSHNWTPTHGQVTNVFNALGQMESDAITTQAFNPTATQADEALFLQSLAQFYFLDLYGQVPYRAVTDYNSIKPAPVYGPAAAVTALTTQLNGIISRNNLAATGPYRASTDAARFLLMKVLLNKGAFISRSSPTFDPADMATVITLGNAIINSGKYSFTPNYFDMFSPKNATLSKEAIWAWPNTAGASQTNVAGINFNSYGINNTWMKTLHYNSFDKQNAYGGAGWNGFSTVADFYNQFEGHGDASATTKIDTTKDKRLGGKYYAGVTDQSGLRPGLLAGQQYNENNVAEVDRHGNALTFTPTVSLVETNPNTLEITGIRIVKYAPDYNAYSGGNQGNQFQFFRYSDVVLMVAEAMMRTNQTASALTLINGLRAARGASTLASISLVNTANVNDPNTLLAERSRELYWEAWRRQDLIRFGVFNVLWALKTADDPKYLLFPIPPAQLIANPNLTQNPGY